MDAMSESNTAVDTTTYVTFVLDSSGSMEKIEDDTRGGFNLFLRDQRDEEGDAYVSLYEFNDDVEVVYQDIEIEDAPELDEENYRPGGRTALHDAITRAIGDTEDLLDALQGHEQPDNVIVVVLTDGKENASETPADVVRERVEEKRENGWEFMFIGANQDAALTAEQMGMDRDKSLDMSHSGEGSKAAHASTSRRISEARRAVRQVDTPRRTGADRAR